MKHKRLFAFSLFVSLLWASLQARQIDLSLNDWRLWLDKEAPVVADASAPLCGWKQLPFQGKQIRIPATVEAYCWGMESGEKFGLSGDYTGVSWFSTDFLLPHIKSSQRLLLKFESVRFCAEVFVNQKFVGKDEAFGTPFYFDITDYVSAGKKNSLAVRIIDPDGNFTWTDFNSHFWGERRITPSYGFGGITGRVELEWVDPNYISDVFVQNTPQITTVCAKVKVDNLLNQKSPDGELRFRLFPASDDNQVLYDKSIRVNGDKLDEYYSFVLQYPKAQLWSPESPNLYWLQIDWNGKDGSSHSVRKRFGFRWFEIKDSKDGRYFQLNGKRIVLRTAISWGFWPVNGIIPTPELAERQIRLAKELGLNMLNFHRGIGQTVLLDKADELGLLYYEEPGGYKTGGNTRDVSLQALNRERFLRMMKRDRSHPSLIIYNMINEISNRQPLPFEIEDLKLFHSQDETRHITYTSSNFFKVLHGGKCPVTPSPVKSFMRPYDTTVYLQGWWDQHFPDGPGVYCDRFYKGPGEGIFRNSDNLHEIVMWGEEGAIGTPPRLQLIKEEIEKNGNLTGWDGDAYLAQYEAFDTFLKTHPDFQKAFPDVDAFTWSFGNVAMYYQGRIIENIRIGNVVDCYAVNGWEETKIENHSGIVDAYRHPKGDTHILAHYNQPLYVAVKLRSKVMQRGDTAIADFYVVNEKNLKGKYRLSVTCSDNKGVFFEKTYAVKLEGGNTYGQLLVKEVKITPREEGYTVVRAFLCEENEVKAEGMDKLYAVGLHEMDSSLDVALLDDSLGHTSNALKSSGIVFRSSTAKEILKSHPDVIVIGAYDRQLAMPEIEARSELLEWVKAGGKLLVLGDADKVSAFLAEKEVLDYRGCVPLRTVWFGGNYAVAKNLYFSGLPCNTAFNWEYQSLAQYHKQRKALRIMNGKCLVAAVAEHKPEVFSALHSLKMGKGEIILSTLDIVRALNRRDETANVVARKLLINLMTLQN